MTVYLFGRILGFLWRKKRGNNNNNSNIINNNNNNNNNNKNIKANSEVKNFRM